jgi:hypothetical protein
MDVTFGRMGVRKSQPALFQMPQAVNNYTAYRRHSHDLQGD